MAPESTGLPCLTGWGCAPSLYRVAIFLQLAQSTGVTTFSVTWETSLISGRPNQPTWPSVQRTQLKISLTSALTCSAIEGADVRPGNSIPINWTTEGN